MLIKIMEYPEKIQILNIIFMKLYPLKMEAGRYCGPPQKMGSSWKHLGEINLADSKGVVAQMPVAAEVGSGDERDELGSG